MTINDPRDDPQYQVGGKKYQALIEGTAAQGQVDPTTVAKFHEKADTDAADTAIHHTLGSKHSQSSPGDHKHDGVSSVKILSGTTINGSRSGGAALVSVIAALVKLGATDATSA
jgi:hypothetical protein